MSITREEIIKEYENAVVASGLAAAAGNEDAAKSYELFKAGLSALRPVSREQVILCKDCRYWQGNNGGHPHPECRWGNDETPDADDYCSFAERKEVNKNG